MSKKTQIRGDYMIVRYYEGGKRKILRNNVTESEAIAHCNRPETSSSTSKRINAQKDVRWFDGYRLMDGRRNARSRMSIMEQIFVANTADRIQAVSCYQW